MRAPPVLLGLLVAGQAVAGTFCWDPVVGADTYNLYVGTLADPTVYTNMEEGGRAYEWYSNDPGPLACYDWTTSAACVGPVCCAAFVEDPRVPLVYYVMTAESSLEPGSESVGTALQVTPCP